MIGRTISHYRIQTKLGEGGMGVVYQAEDTNLERVVALKFVAPHLVSDDAARKRFEREAKAVAALDHPNICTVFEIGEGDGTVFLAMAFVEGSTLKDLIAQRPLKLKVALDIAIQTAEGIRAAHQKGIVHRDIKPGNIMVNSQKQVKIMDFGLAQFDDATISQTATVAGTPAYMSPEQAAGQPTDQRTDMWALGATLYEMIIGQQPFAREHTEAVFYAIKYEEPEPITALRSGVPMELEWIVGKCLAKDAAARYQHMDDLIVDLSALRKKLVSDSSSSRAPARPPKTANPAPSIRTTTLFVILAAAAVIMILVGVRMFRRSPGADLQRTVKFTITPHKLVRGSDTDIDAELSISRDGKHIAYVEAEGGQLWLRDIDQEQARLVPGALGVYQAFWSADSQSIGYAAGGFAPGLNLVRIPSEGGTPAVITKLAGSFRRANWSSDGETIVYCDTTGMFTVPARGGTPARIVEHPHIEHPSFLDLPDGRRALLYQALDGPGGHGIYVQIIGEDRRRLLTMSSSSNPYPAYSPSGHIIYVDGRSDSTGIWALPFSLASLEPTGKAFRIAEHGSSPQVSRTDTLVYTDVPSDRLQLGWFDRSGKMLSTIGEPLRQSSPTLSPDGRTLAVVISEGDPDIWTYDVDRGIKSRFTFDSSPELIGAWNASGNEFLYSSQHNGHFDIFSKPTAGNGEVRLLASTPADKRASDFSNERFVIYSANTPATKFDLLYRERRKDGSLGEEMTFLQTPFNENAPQFSPEGNFVAYVSDESGRNEVYVRDFPKGANKWQISVNSGIAPRWRRDGNEMFYVERQKLMAVNVSTRPGFSPGKPAPLFEKRSLQVVFPNYDVTADGQRFVVLDRLNEQPLLIHVVHNWFEEFRGEQTAR